MRTIAIVQARMGSQRLPGKALLDLCGKPILQHVVERLRQAHTLDDIVVAIPNLKKDDALAEFCDKLGYLLFRGSEADVLSRYWEAANFFKADIVVRITADCPLIDSEVVDAIIDRHRRSDGNDYTSNVIVRTFPRGMDTEVVSRNCLHRLHREARDHLYREHVTNFVHDHPNTFRRENVVRARGDRSDLRLCVDTQDDLEVVEAVVHALEKESTRPNIHWGVEDVIIFLDQHPEIARRNAHVQHVGDPKPEGGQEHRWIGAHDERAGEEVRERVTLVRVTFGYANAVSSPEAWLRAIDRVGPDLITDVYRLREEHDLH